MKRWLMVVSVLVAACPSLEYSLEGRPCEEGDCVRDWQCHPELLVCVPVPEVPCARGGICPDDVVPGDSCGTVGVFLPCATSLPTDCSRGCFTCQPDGSWSDCSVAVCELGLVNSCGTCIEDCVEKITGAIPACNSNGNHRLCDYVTCAEGHKDADANRSNGCECLPESDTEFLCDGLDEDCDGAADDGLFNCQCTGGGEPADESCDGVDNNCDGQIDEGFACTPGALSDCEPPGALEPRSGTRVCGEDCAWGAVCTPKDQVPPDVVRDLVAIAGDVSVALSWTNPDNPDLHSCVVRRGADAYPTDQNSGTLVFDTRSTVPGGSETTLDVGLSNGENYFYVVFCRDRSNNWETTRTLGQNSATVTPEGTLPDRVDDLVTIDGADSITTVSYTTPAAPMDRCRLLRKQGRFAEGPDDATAVPVGEDVTAVGSIQSVVDAALNNGTTYYYVVYCQNGTVWNESLVLGQNAGTALPLDALADNPIDFSASDGENGMVTTQFTMPSMPVSDCSLTRREGSYASGHDDTTATIVGPVFDQANAAITFADTTVVNGVSYYYAVFCRNGTTWNDTRFDGKNSDVGTPAVPQAVNPTDLMASNGEDRRVVLSFTQAGGDTTQCNLMRRSDDTYPTSTADGVAVAQFTSSGSQSHTDSASVLNGTSYNYAVFCTNGVAWNNSGVLGENLAIGTPLDPAPANPSDVVATDGDVNAATISFTMPSAPVSDCTLFRSSDGSYANGHRDPQAVEIGVYGAPGSSISHIDFPLAAGTTHHYSVFCRNGTTWNDQRPGSNEDFALVAAAAPIAFVGSVTATSGTGTVDSPPVTAAVGDLYIAAIGTSPQTNVSSVSGLGLTWTRAAQQCGTSGTRKSEIWWALGDGSVVDDRVTATVGFSTGKLLIAVLTYRHVNVFDPVGVAAGANPAGISGACGSGAQSSSWSVTLPNVSPQNVIVSVISMGRNSNGVVAPTVERAEFSRGNGNNSRAVAVVERAVTSPADRTIGGSLGGSDPWAAVAVEIKN